MPPLEWMSKEWMIIKFPDTQWEEYRELLLKAYDRCPPAMTLTPVILTDGTEGEAVLGNSVLSKAALDNSALDNAVSDTFREAFPGIGKAEVIASPLSGRYDVTLLGALFEEFLREREPSVALFPAVGTGKQTAAWLAGRMGFGLTADLTDFYMDKEERLHQIRMAYGGSLQAEIISRSRIQMATVKVEGKSPSVVIAGGLGAGKEGFRLLCELAEISGGQLGATRAAVDAGLAPFECQIGQSGSYVKPAYYLAFGISGAVQHLAGMKDSGIIIAVNTDRKAPIFQHADYAVCGDVCGTAKEIIKLLARKGVKENQ